MIMMFVGKGRLFFGGGGEARGEEIPGPSVLILAASLAWHMSTLLF